MPIPESADAEAITALLHTYERSLNESDPDLAASVYADDGVFMPLFLPTASGEGIRGSYEQIFQTIKLEIAFTIDDISLAGDCAHALTRSEGHVTVLGTGDRGPEANREIFVFTRGADGWKIARYMFNKTTPPAAP